MEMGCSAPPAAARLANNSVFSAGRGPIIVSTLFIIDCLDLSITRASPHFLAQGTPVRDWSRTFRMPAIIGAGNGMKTKPGFKSIITTCKLQRQIRSQIAYCEPNTLHSCRKNSELRLNADYANFFRNIDRGGS